jgi:hypothetical protein
MSTLSFLNRARMSVPAGDWDLLGLYDCGAGAGRLSEYYLYNELRDAKRYSSAYAEYSWK